MIEEASKIPHKVTRAVDEVAEMVEVGYGIVLSMDQAASRIHKAPSKFSDSHSGNVEEVAESLTKKGKL